MSEEKKEAPVVSQPKSERSSQQRLGPRQPTLHKYSRQKSSEPESAGDDCDIDLAGIEIDSLSQDDR